MGKHFLKLPKMGESVIEATLTKWLKGLGDLIEVDDVVVEIATDKVDSDVPSEVSGILIEKKFSENDVVQIGEVMAVIQTNGDTPEVESVSPALEEVEEKEEATESEPVAVEVLQDTSPVEVPTYALHDPSPEFEKNSEPIPTSSNANEFYSPLVKSIARAEHISAAELKQIMGSGKNNRITKKDVLSFLEQRNEVGLKPQAPPPVAYQKPEALRKAEDQIIEMSRMAKLTASHMINSKQTSAHVQSFIEADLTNLWDWRERVKNDFYEREGEKLTFTPLLITALIKALKDFPLLNSSVDGDTIVQKKAINIGMAAAMADGNLIVPVIKNADRLNLVGLAKSVNDMAFRARKQQLKPDEVTDGTFTFTNIGNFGSLTGTPIINQPQVGIVAVGVIRKIPAVIETSQGDSIAIRKKMIISHSYDHRIINGAMGGQFIKSMTDYLEQWDENHTL
ncbi:MAG: diapophytoene dehydrogenase [Flavobacteriaceae bacterium]|nr:diapophytoene dehydrogenase [Flavobacteriaceae bacterium]